MGCKILITTRFQPVLVSMRTKKDFSIVALNEEESWKLFEEKAVDVVKNPVFLTIGKKVAKRCAGLPVLIVTLAASLSKRPELHAWNDALKQLKKMNNKQMHDIVNSAIETISYNHLEETHKRLFVLCGVIGGDASVEQVLQYCMGWGLFDDEVLTVQGARDRLHSLILDLKDHCLLLDDHRRNAIKMHDVVRDVAISIGKKDSNMFPIGDNDAQLNTWPMDDVLEKCTSIVVHACPNLSCLPQQLEFPELEMCILSGSWLTIPNSFFEKTGKLKVLDMSGLGFSMLPSSLSCLKNLQALRFHDCPNLEDISAVGELKKLQTLSFGGPYIKELPSGIGDLSELRLLAVRRCFRLEVIPAGLIRGLSRLEELYVGSKLVRWEAEECISGWERNNASLVELKHLPNLRSLEIAVQDAKLLPQDLDFEKFERYQIIVGRMWDYSSRWGWFTSLEITRKICLQVGSTSINHWQHGVKKLFRTTECLCLGEVEGVKNVSPELDENGFPELKHLFIKKDYEMQYIVNVEDGQHQVAFPSLESLRLSHLLNLQKICNGPLMKESFNRLAIMEVENCNELRSLFSFSMATELRCLEEIRVSSCNALEGIVGENKEDGGVWKKIEFGQLRKLSLKSLPKLKNFISYGEISRASHKSSTSDEELQSGVPFFEKVLFPKLEELELFEISNLAEIWSHKLGETSCCNLTRLSVKNCDKLKYLLTPSICSGLAQLQALNIVSCVKMKSVVAKEKGETKIEEFSFPKLSHIRLQNLVNLTTFYEKIDSNDNTDIAVKPLFNEKVSFPKLDNLNITECERLKYLLTPSAALALVELQSLTVQECARMEHVVAKEEGETNIEMISFPQLTYLCLKNLSDLVTFYAGSEDSNENLDNAMQPLFNEKIQFPMLEELIIYELGSISILWQNPRLYQVNSFCKLEQVAIRTCDSLVKMFSSTTHSGSKNDPQESLMFQNLREVSFHLCQSLKHVFPVSVAHCLNKLEEIEIKDCEVLETIIDDESYEQSTQQVAAFMFPKLAKLQLERLPNMECFYPREHTTKCPALKDLQVLDCGKVSPMDFLSFQQVQGDGQLEKLISGLMDLTIRNMGMKKILDFPPHLFHSLEWLTITEFEGVFPSKFLSRIHCQLKTLEVVNCSFQEVFPFPFPYEGQVTSQADDGVFFPQLETLWLKKLPELKSICKQDQYFPFISNILDKIRDLYVSECPRLTRVVSPSVSFGLLQRLTISNCNGLINVIQLSTATSLKQLRTLTVIGCEMIQEIIGGEVGDYESSLDDDDEIIFSQLQCMQLKKLPRLTTFCSSRDYTFNFPLLETVTVIECPNMKTFYRGITTTPLLEKDLNTTVELIYTELEAKRQDTTQILETCKEVVEGRSKDSDKLVKVVDDIPDKGKGKQSQETPLPEQVVAISQPVLPSSSRSTKNPSNQVSEVEAKRLGATLPSTSSSNHFEGEAQTHVNSARMESWDATNQEENVADICDKGKGKEHGVKKTPHYSDPSCSNCTGQEQTVAAYLASSQHVVASSPQLIPQNNNHPDDASPSLATKVESERLAIIPLISSTNHFEAQAQAHDNEAEYCTEQTIEDHNKKEEVVDTCEKGKEKEVEVSLHVMEHVDTSKDTCLPSDPTFSNYAAPEQTVVASSSQLSPPIINLSDGVKASSLATQVEMVLATSSKNQFEAEAQFHDKSLKKSTDEPRKDGQICINGSSDASDSQHEDYEELDVVKDFSPWLSEFLQILQTQPPVDSISAEQVQFMEHAMEWLGPYLEKSKECVERNKAISELKLEIADMEVRMQALKEKQTALEDENKATACSVLRRR